MLPNVPNGGPSKQAISRQLSNLFRRLLLTLNKTVISFASVFDSCLKNNRDIMPSGKKQHVKCKLTTMLF